jgi:hypothetical protein
VSGSISPSGSGSQGTGGGWASLTAGCDVSIVVVNHNSLNLLRRCIGHLASLAPPSSELIIVDNGSTDASRDWLQEQQGTVGRVVCSDQNVGFAAGCNLGIEQATGRYILLLNTDAFPEPSSLDVLVRYLDQHLDTAVAGPQLLYPNGRWQRSSGFVPSPRSAMLDAMGITSAAHVISGALWKLSGRWWRPYPVQYVDGACMLIRRAILDRIGGLDERFFMFVEDAEFCHRVRQHGWKVRYVPQSHVVHLRGGSSSQKDLAGALRMRRRSESEFVLRLWGRTALRRFLFWRRLNFRLRMLAATAFRDEPQRNRYKAAWQAYGQEER